MKRSLQWDIFCKVIDNFGDIGVAWRLSAELAARGQQVRLWIDDASALDWMAPSGDAAVQVRPWTAAETVTALAVPPDVLVEAFGCDVPAAFLSAHIWSSTTAPPLWLNLEYLSAESYVTRSHGLPSPVMSGPAAGETKWFFYPGFTQGTGGLLRESNLATRQDAFSSPSWLAAQGVEVSDALVVSLFCYEPQALAQLLGEWQTSGHHGRSVALLVAAGRASEAVKSAQESARGGTGSPSLSITYLPWLTQTEFDHLLWSSDLNFVRGEDSLVRAIWAGKPLIWHIYPQEDSAHLTKLEAYLACIEAPASLREFHRAWNAPGQEQVHWPTPPLLAEWTAHAQATKAALWRLPDLASTLIGFAAKKR
jgi:uncharacterized repeat protein (TIGR03837 family)